MNTANLILIGKTGVGKSTLVNSIIGKKVTPTGKGKKVTVENKVYTCKKSIQSFDGKRSEDWMLKIYDTVGLELDEKITESTLQDVENYIDDTKKYGNGMEIIIVWLCINQKNKRFEECELAIVDDMSMKYEIPFSVVLTQCISDEKSDLEKQIENDYPNIHVCRVLAEDYKTKVGVLNAFGVEEAIEESTLGYNHNKVDVLELKLSRLDAERQNRINSIEEKGNLCIAKYSKSAKKIGKISAVCIPFVHQICIKMLMELHKIAGMDRSYGFATNAFANMLVGVIVTPLMMIPGLSSAGAFGYVEAVGECYLSALLEVIQSSSDDELKNNKIVSERIKQELKKWKDKEI